MKIAYAFTVVEFVVMWLGITAITYSFWNSAGVFNGDHVSVWVVAGLIHLPGLFWALGQIPWFVAFEGEYLSHLR